MNRYPPSRRVRRAPWRKPKTFNLHDELIERALTQTPVQDWPEVCRRPGRSQEDNDAVYHGVVVPVSMSLAIPVMDDEGRPLLDKEKKPKTAAGTEDWHAVVLCSTNLERYTRPPTTGN